MGIPTKQFAALVGQERAAELLRTKPRTSKHKNVRTMSGGIKFHSKLEAAYFEQLQQRQLARDIRWFCRQPRFVLPGGVEYLADFIVVENDGRVRVIDCKGQRTYVYSVKAKQVKAIYGIEIEEV